jgi:PHD/YefM family antitoxin component YafN of YafNO toxin-antitoxin module
MRDITSAIRDTVSISLFNRGLAGKIFDEVKQSGAKVVMKNNAAECVLLSPDEYINLMDEVNDARLLMLASQRLEKYDPATTISEQEMYARLGIRPEDLEDYDKEQNAAT